MLVVPDRCKNGVVVIESCGCMLIVSPTFVIGSEGILDKDPDVGQRQGHKLKTAKSEQDDHCDEIVFEITSTGMDGGGSLPVRWFAGAPVVLSWR